MTIFKTVLSPGVAILLQVAKSGWASPLLCAPQRTSKHRVTINFLMEMPGARQEADPWVLWSHENNQGLWQDNFYTFYHEN